MTTLLRQKQYGVDYGPLKGAFTNKNIAPSDIDGIVERYGHLLVFECKHEDDDTLSKGQEITLQSVAARPKITVLEAMLSGRRTEAGALLFEPLRLRRIRHDGFSDWEETDIEDFRKRCRQWSERADFGQFSR